MWKPRRINDGAEAAIPYRGLAAALVPDRFRVIGGQQSRTLPKRIPQGCRPVMLLQQITERLGCQLLQGSARLVRKLGEGVPSLALELQPAANRDG